MSSEQSGIEQTDLFSSLLNDPEFKEAIEAINSFATPKAKRSPTSRRSRSTKSDKPFKSKVVVDVSEVRRSGRLRREPPRYTEADLPDDRLVRHVERNRCRFSEEYLKKISERQTNFWKNYWQKKREEKQRLNSAAKEDNDSAEKVENPKKKRKSSSGRGFSKEYLKELSERRTQYWKEYWRIKREEKARFEAALQENPENHTDFEGDGNKVNPNNNEYSEIADSVNDRNGSLGKLDEVENEQHKEGYKSETMAVDEKENNDINKSSGITQKSCIEDLKSNTDKNNDETSTARRTSLRKNKSTASEPDTSCTTVSPNVTCVAPRRSLRKTKS